MCKYDKGNGMIILDFSDYYSSQEKLLATTKSLPKSNRIQTCNNVTKEPNKTKVLIMSNNI